jgi:dolichol-phosphate mannosyltransferase
MDDIVSNGYVFQIELTWRAIQQGFVVGEVPIQFPDRTRGESKMSGAIVREAVIKVWELRLRKAAMRHKSAGKAH